ncbi:hypothetical protein EHQ12_08270 [Leptospira gomenensis]|uniref:Uncharacterized protein n=1 Tax=Leptospira gomenensis TaxID=2484974 RepID=A0A5F1Z1Q8_9LEPT|nr:hypothetical protein [Leptospira gomenensis]TGK35948.1 hypothetical protein EHQ17_05025 [Leptospira gomenensis]TGK40020.1 hypothetical protein EHQ12_08270 [Leptospira gomenensis]TGK51470.1 hypothetical protein EHQ07_02660 [Leptospira gomenensis]TGK68027.1 hypothetical protein EHQ13_01195 [Leptospira gomenensis]
MSSNRISAQNEKRNDRRMESAFLSLVITCIVTNLFCSSLLPMEKRNYPKEVSMEKNRTLRDWISIKKERFGLNLFVDEISENRFRMKYYSAREFYFDVYLACSFTVSRSTENTFKITNMSYVMDNGCSKSNQTDWCYQSRGVVGPVSEEENEKYMLPCLREFLNEL